jgi:hypothetical protein
LEITGTFLLLKYKAGNREGVNTSEPGLTGGSGRRKYVFKTENISESDNK